MIPNDFLDPMKAFSIATEFLVCDITDCVDHHMDMEMEFVRS